MNELTIKPSKAAYRGTLVASLPLTVALLAWNLATNRSNPLVLAIVIVVTMAVCVVGLWLYFRNTTVTIAPGSLTRTTMFGATRTWTTTTSLRVVVVQYYRASMAIQNSQLFVLDETGRRVLRMRGETWSPDQMNQAIAAIRVQPEVISQLMTPRQVRKYLPRAVSWWEANPVPVALLIVLVIIVVIVAVFAATGQFSDY